MRLFILLLNMLWCAASMAQTAPLQLAETYEGDIAISEYLISEKLDGIRARWTGSKLVTRNGHPITPPAWFTQNWPQEPMDGELWSQRSDFETIASTVLSHHPDERWQAIRMMVFDLPITDLPFERRVARMKKLVAETRHPNLRMIQQFTLDSLPALESALDNIIRQGGEGLMLHHRQARYQQGRNPGLLKAKRFQDDEAKVLAHLPGKGKFKGLMGSLLVESRQGQQFKIGSGFSLAQRRSPPPIGSWITYKYYGLTQRGIPRFASFLHQRPRADIPH
ncbi:DNA ligase [uncultured Alteromonas sp.]|uniref:DNA ligase n=1 Tax=uncultured Alteromonas sp. TaxID=179113 RepID=UPI0025D979D2|nr:DNA ligase [uncultured Alteromonas sp.]